MCRTSGRWWLQQYSYSQLLLKHQEPYGTIWAVRKLRVPCFGKGQRLKGPSSWKAKRSWDDPAGLARRPQVWKPNKQSPRCLQSRLDQHCFLKPFRFQLTRQWLLPHVSLEQASYTRPRIPYYILGVSNLLSFSCWLQDLFPGTVRHKDRKKMQSLHFGLPAVSSIPSRSELAAQKSCLTPEQR